MWLVPSPRRSHTLSCAPSARMYARRSPSGDNDARRTVPTFVRRPASNRKSRARSKTRSTDLVMTHATPPSTAATMAPRRRSRVNAEASAPQRRLSGGHKRRNWHDVRTVVDRRDEAVAAPGQGLDEPGGLGRVAQDVSQAPDGRVQAGLEVHERVVRPQSCRSWSRVTSAPRRASNVASSRNSCCGRTVAVPGGELARTQVQREVAEADDGGAFRDAEHGGALETRSILPKAVAFTRISSASHTAVIETAHAASQSVWTSPRARLSQGHLPRRAGPMACLTCDPSVTYHLPVIDDDRRIQGARRSHASLPARPALRA